MKIKDLPKDMTLEGIKVKIPEHVTCQIHEGYWKSQWGYPEGKAGVWLTKNLNDTQMYPAFLNKLEDALDWEVITKKYKPKSKEVK